MRTFAPASVVLIVGVGALAACSPTQPEGEDRAMAQPPADKPVAEQPSPQNDALARTQDNCLLVVWQDQDTRDERFDLAHDRASGGAISCATGTSASQFDVAISTLRDAARSGDKARLLREVGLPLLYIDGDGKRREIKDRTEVEAVFDEIFDPAMIEVLQKIDLSRMSVAKDQGGFFELGAIWLVVDRDGGRPRLMTVNRQALDEALDTARERADRNQGEPVPFD